MGTIVSTVLIAAPLAFLVGWLCSKALFRYLAAAATEQSPAGETMQSDATGRGEAAQESSDPDLARRLRQRVGQLQQELKPLKGEVELLKEAVVERDQTILELRQKLQVNSTLPEETPATAAATETARHRQLQESLHAQLQQLEEQNQELSAASEAARARAGRIAERYLKWRKKLAPVIRQFRQQRAMINELREELRQRDLRQQASQSARMRGEIPAKENAAKQRPESAGPGSVQAENLQALRGVGPAMHKRLNEAGVYRLQQLAAMDGNALRQLCHALGMGAGAIARCDWAQESRQLILPAEVSPSVALPEKLSA